MSGLERSVAQWRAYVSRRRMFHTVDVDELEDHLRGRIDDLVASGLDEDEAFLIAVRRMGAIDELSREFAREHSERLWKQLVLPADEPVRARALTSALACGVGAGLALKVLIEAAPDLAPRLATVVVLPFLALYFAVTRTVSARALTAAVLGLVVLAVPLAWYPQGDSTGVLMVLHAPVVVWFGICLVYRGSRMDAVRFTGELAVYYFMLAVGGGGLTALTAASFDLIGRDAEPFITSWLLPCCAAGAVVVAAWLVEAKQSVVENFLPVLARVFTPLVCLMLAAVLVAFSSSPDVIAIDRDLLVLMAAILLLVLGAYLYALSAREPLAPVGLFDRLQLALLTLAIAVDVVVLVAMVVRIAEFGSSPNKVAALGLNLIILTNLVRSLWLSTGFVRGTRPFADVERWQTAYLPVYLAWAAFVCIGFPPMFDFA